MTDQKQTIKIKLVKSLIGRTEKQKKNAKSLGLKYIDQVVEKKNIPTIQGMVKKICHLVSVE